MDEVQIIPPSKGVPERQRGRGMLVRHLANLFINPLNISLRLLGKLLLNSSNIPLRRFAFATRRCPPSKGESGLKSSIFFMLDAIALKCLHQRRIV